MIKITALLVMSFATSAYTFAKPHADADIETLRAFQIDRVAASQKYGEASYLANAETIYTKVKDEGGSEYDLVGIASTTVVYNGKYLTNINLQNVYDVAGEKITTDVANKWVNKTLEGNFSHEVSSISNDEVNIEVLSTVAIDTLLLEGAIAQINMRNSEMN